LNFFQKFCCPLLTAIKEGLYPPKQQENPIQAAVKKAKESIEEAKTEIAESLKGTPVNPGDESTVIQKLKANTKQRTAKSIAFENALRKKIQEKKKNSKQS
jgi:hypothetical protein